MKILIACGGTGGHIFPGLSLAQELDRRGVKDVLLAGTDHPLEVKLFGSFGFPYVLLPVAKMSADPAGFVRFIFRFLRASARSAKLLADYKPDVIVGFGGYASFPVCLLGALAGKPLYLHEQNCEAGMANKVLAVFARRVAVSFEQTKTAFGEKAVFTGNPIRRKLLSASREEALKSYGLSGDKFTILVLGGSQGSQRINMVVGDMLGILDDREKAGIQIIHIAGMKNYEDVFARYRTSGVEACVYDFVEDIGSAYAPADLVISRAGATALFEIAALGIPSIMIPYRFAGGHQYYNAAALAMTGATVIIREEGLTPQTLKDKVFELIGNTNALKPMSEAAKGFAVADAAGRLADCIS
jgi:UDP-N-acetylglucosamine--N-acetylmuramyl-(pentapeptide) pyrophosphoryl-undecaprenol N-acetylglucosamine transferase